MNVTSGRDEWLSALASGRGVLASVDMNAREGGSVT